MSTMKQQTSKPDKNPASSKFSVLHLPAWTIMLIFLAFTLFFFRSQIFGSMFFWEDFVEYVYPTQSFAAQSLAQGTIPFWTPYTFAGMPFLADVAVGFFYPPNMLLSLTVSGGQLPVKALEMVIILHFFMAQLTMYKLCRFWKISQIGSMLSAVSFAFSGIFVCHVFHPMMVYHFSWFPLIFLYFHRAISELRLKSALLCGLTFGIVMLSGHPQTTLYLAFFLFIHTIWFGVSGLIKKEISGVNIVKFLGFAALPIVLAAGIFAVQLLHSSEFASLSQRNEYSFEKASDGSLQAKQILSAVVPKLFGYSDSVQSQNAPFYLEGGKYYHYWETAFYFGIPALLLGLMGFLTYYKTRLGGFLIFAAIFGFLFALGSNGFVFPVFFDIPFFHTFRQPARMMFFVVFAFTFMAGFGYDSLIGRRTSLKAILLVASPIFLLAASAYSGILPALFNVPERILPAIQSFGGSATFLVFIATGLIIAVQRPVIPAQIAGLLCILLTFIDLNMFGGAFNSKSSNPEVEYKINPQLETLLKAQPPEEIFRVKMRDNGYMPMKRNQGMMSKIMLYEGYVPVLLERINPLTPAPKSTLDLLSMKYEIVIDSAQRGAHFAERPDRFPQARMVYKSLVLTEDKIQTTMKSGNVDFLNEVVLEQNAPIELPNLLAMEVKNDVRCIQYKNNSLKYEVNTSQNGILCLSEVWYPAWKVTVDGNPAELLRTNYSLRGVAVPAGKHSVEMHYASVAFAKGMWISLTSLLVAIVGIVWTSRKKDKI